MRKCIECDHLEDGRIWTSLCINCIFGGDKKFGEDYFQEKDTDAKRIKGGVMTNAENMRVEAVAELKEEIERLRIARDLARVETTGEFKLREKAEAERDRSIGAVDELKEELEGIIFLGVDKWFDDGDPVLNENPTHRAAMAREKALQLIEKAEAESKEEIERLTFAVKKVTAERDFALKMKNQMRAKLDESREATARRCVAICEGIASEIDNFDGDRAFVTTAVVIAAIKSELLGGGGGISRHNINIVFDGPPGPDSCRFVEVETDDGRSIKIGEWINRGDGLWALKIEGVEVKQ